MATVTDIVTDAYLEIGVLAAGELLSANTGLQALGLLRFQQLLDAWQADRLSLAVQQRSTFTLTSGTSTVTLGTGGSVIGSVSAHANHLRRAGGLCRTAS